MKKLFYQKKIKVKKLINMTPQELNILFWEDKIIKQKLILSLMTGHHMYLKIIIKL